MKIKIERGTIERDKAIALYKHLKENENYCMHDAYYLCTNRDYKVLTEEEANEEVREYILNSLWAFNYDFLSAHSKAIWNIPKKEFVAMQGKLCESFNEAIKAMIDDIEYFIQNSINADGRGRFISSYDGEEHAQKVNGVWYYIYRVS